LIGLGQDLVERHVVTGFRAHDVRLVAAMHVTESIGYLRSMRPISAALPWWFSTRQRSKYRSTLKGV
jgi:hypothetical protein